jgi:hypothetical protein
MVNLRRNDVMCMKCDKTSDNQQYGRISSDDLDVNKLVRQPAKGTIAP